ncbi:MAG TPA: SGNH/GDSL hydrolase family protein [Verrucomicrobiae bacterium]|jgi:lysophospholipase L1-like esterase|nr:SGNH/GDSL hydrolase family protein [Verrucomicrobiae bacterium]
MPFSVWTTILTQFVLIAGAILMAVWIRAPWVSIGGIGLLGGSLLVGRFAKKNAATAVWAFSVLVWVGCATTDVWYVYFAMIAGLIAAALWINAPAREKAIGMTWALLSAVICIGAGYDQNQQGPFYFGILEAVGLLIILRAAFHVSPAGVQVANTALLVLVGLPAIDFFVRPSYQLDPRPETCWKYYSYEGARGNPSAFARWWPYYLEEADAAQSVIFESLPGRIPNFCLRPKSHALLFESKVSINGQGFRGPEIPAEKGDAYRIVALGESTTFGMTIGPQDKPWPEVLEQLIRERIKPSRPVQVINAGIPAYSLTDNLTRLPGQILSVHPDMIISYHGFNGFNLINPAVPQLKGPPPPKYCGRPLKLPADCEYRFKMFLFRRGHAPESNTRRAPPIDPLATPYAARYRQLIEFTQTNDIRLALANFSMAVNKNSDTNVIEFYRSAFKAIYIQIRANEIHSKLIAELAAQNRNVCLVDTHPHLDGVDQMFIDPIHFTQAGRRQLAENIFAGIRDVLEKDLKRKAPDHARLTGPLRGGQFPALEKNDAEDAEKTAQQ